MYVGSTLNRKSIVLYLSLVVKVRDSTPARAQIAAAVWGTISEYGIEGATMRRIAAVAGFSVGRLQHYFASREELLCYSCQAMVDLAGESSSLPPQADADTDPVGAGRWRVRQLLVHAFDQSAEYRMGARVWAAFVAHAVVDPAIARIVVEAQLGLEREVARLLVDVGCDPGSARHLVALSEGLAQRTLTGAVSADAAAAEIDGAITRVLGEESGRPRASETGPDEVP